MADDQKIQIGAEIWNKCASIMGLKEGDPDNMSRYLKEICIEIADFAIERIGEVESDNNNKETS